MSNEKDFNKVLPQVGDVVEVYGPHRGWVRTQPVVAILKTDDGIVIGFSVVHPDADTAGLSILYENGKTPWRWPVDGSRVTLCNDCIGNMLRSRANGGEFPVVTTRGNGFLACSHKTFVIDPHRG